MGQQKNKKTKKDPDSTGESSTHSTHSSSSGNVVSNADHTSQALNEASSVLYPKTSTPLPIPEKTSKATPISNIEKIPKDTKDKISKQMKETNKK